MYACMFGDCGKMCVHLEAPSSAQGKLGASSLSAQSLPAATPASPAAAVKQCVLGADIPLSSRAVTPSWGNRTFLDALCHGKKGEALHLLCFAFHKPYHSSNKRGGGHGGGERRSFFS